MRGTRTGRTVMSAVRFWRCAAVSVQVAALILALGCESASPTAPRETSTVRPSPPSMSTPRPAGAIAGTVTINSEARPIVWVELQGGYRYTGFATTIPSGSWEWTHVPLGDYVVVIKTPPGLTCDARRNPRPWKRISARSSTSRALAM